MARLTDAQKHDRRKARWYGKGCAAAIDLAVFQGREAASWRRTDAATGETSHEHLTASWERRSAEALQEAIECAVLAAHHAHRALDPNPTTAD